MSVYKKALEDGRASDGKADGGKPRASLLFVQFGKALMSIVRVLTFGALKYPKPPLDDSWRDVPNAIVRYQDALYRHLDKIFVEGEWIDPESGEPHITHAQCNMLFLYELMSKFYGDPVDITGVNKCEGAAEADPLYNQWTLDLGLYYAPIEHNAAFAAYLGWLDTGRSRGSRPATLKRFIQSSKDSGCHDMATLLVYLQYLEKFYNERI